MPEGILSLRPLQTKLRGPRAPRRDYSREMLSAPQCGGPMVLIERLPMITHASAPTYSPPRPEPHQYMLADFRGVILLAVHPRFAGVRGLPLISGEQGSIIHRDGEQLRAMYPVGLLH